MKLVLPIPSPVPLDVLSTSIDALLGRDMTVGPYSSNIVTRFANCCQNNGIENLWMLAMHQKKKFSKRKNTGPHTVVFAESILESVGCTFGMFPELRDALERVVAELPSQYSYVDFAVVCTAFAGMSRVKDPTIIAGLAKYGLRPGMPIEELFVHGSREPKKLTVTEELLAFGKKTVGEIARKEQMSGGPPPNSDPFVSMGDFAFMLRVTGDTTMIEIMYFFATLPQEHTSKSPDARSVFLRWARMELSDEAFVGLMNMNK